MSVGMGWPWGLWGGSVRGCWEALGDEHKMLGWGHGFLLGSVCPGCTDLGTMRLGPRARAAHRTGVWQLAGGGAEEATSTLTQGCNSAQSGPTLCDPTDRSLPGSSVHGILQARILEWIAMLSSRGAF